jgi:hypothetical protein
VRVPSPFATNDSLFRLVNAAQRAPSVHNTQPWSFRIAGADRIDLRANRGRQLRIADPHGREMVISCGAALFNLRMALRMAGHDPLVWLVPDRENDPDLLASVETSPSRARPPTRTAQLLYEAIWQRHTNREPFSNRIVPMPIVADLEHAAWREHAHVWLLHRHGAKLMLQVTAKADHALAGDAQYVSELRRCVSGGLGRGVPTAAFGPRPKRAYAPVRDLGLGSPGTRRVDRFEHRARLMVLSTETDTPLDWLRAGQALERVLLTATRYGVAASFLTQPFELQDRYATPIFRLPSWLKHPQMVLRLGYGPPVAATPREAFPDLVDCRIQPPMPVRQPDAAGKPLRAA